MPQHDDDIIPHQDEVEQVIDQQIAKTIEMFDIDDIIIPDAALTLYSGGFYLVGNELVIVQARFGRAASAAVAVHGNTVLGSFVDEVRPALNPAENEPEFAAHARKADSSAYAEGTVLFDVDGGISFDPHGVIAAATNIEFRIPSARFLLTDSAALRTIL